MSSGTFSSAEDLRDSFGDPLFGISVGQYHEMIDQGILTPDDPVELLEGLLVYKMPKKPIHWIITRRLCKALEKLNIRGHFIHSQDPITTLESEPEPDAAVIEGTDEDYLENNPPPEKVKLVAEVADSSMVRDRGRKKRVYARAGIPTYWIVSAKQRTIEVYTEPSGPGPRPSFANCQVVKAREKLEVTVDGKVVGEIDVAKLFPK